MARRGWTLLAVLLLSQSWAGAQEKVPAEGAFVAVPTIREVRLEGEDAFRERDLLEASGLSLPRRWYLWKRPLNLSPEEVELRLAEIVLYCKRHGYFEASAQLEPAEDDVAIIRLAEGEPSLVASVRIEVEPEGTWGSVPRDIASTLPLKEGDTFDVAHYEEAAGEAAKAWKEVGHPFAQVKPEALVDQSTHRVEVLYRVAPGPALAVGSISIEGAEGLREQTLRFALRLREGEPWSQSSVDKSLEALYRLGLFEAVSITPDPGQVEGGRVGVTVRVRQGSHHRIKSGVGYGQEDGVRVRFGWETARVGPRPLTFGVDAKLSERESTGIVYSRWPYFRNPWTTLVLDASLGKRDEVEFSFRSSRFQAGVDRSFGPNWKWSFYLAGEKIISVTPSKALEVAVPPAALDLSVLSSASLSASRDTTDAPLNPTRGTLLSLYAEPTVVDAGRRSFTKVLCEGRAYLRPVPPAILALRLKVGAILTPGDPQDIPITRRFYAGGSMSVRGYRYNGLGPLAENGALLGGNGLVEGSAELRFPVKGDLLGLIFLDAGNAIADPGDVGNLKLYSGTGFGVRYDTPVGPIGIDLGFKLRKDPKDSSPWMLHVFVGYAF